MSVFSYMVDDTIEVFMDDFSLVGDSFDDKLKDMDDILKYCEKYNLVLSWEKCHFMVKEGIVLDHQISQKSIEVNRGKFKLIKKFRPPSMKWLEVF